MKYSIDDEKIVFDDHFKMLQAKVSYDTFRGGQIKTRRLAFERGDSVAIILFEVETQSILLTNQFRYPSCKHNKGWLIEIPAGSIDENEEPSECIVREIMEELGYEIGNPTHIDTFYTSPGSSTERMFLFYKEVSEKDKTNAGGGNPGENEDIQLVKIPISELSERISEFSDAKTIVGLQWFLLNKK